MEPLPGRVAELRRSAAQAAGDGHGHHADARALAARALSGTGLWPPAASARRASERRRHDLPCQSRVGADADPPGHLPPGAGPAQRGRHAAQAQPAQHDAGTAQPLAALHVGADQQRAATAHPARQCQPAPRRLCRIRPRKHDERRTLCGVCAAVAGLPSESGGEIGRFRDWEIGVWRRARSPRRR